MAVDGGDGGTSVDLDSEDADLTESMADRTRSDPASDPLTGAELGAGEGAGPVKRYEEAA